MKEECSVILEKAQSKLKTAAIDLDAGQFDDSVSRSYYSVFHAITACLLHKGLSFSSHSQVIGAFNREFIKTNVFPSYFSKDIQTLFDDRQSGDYDVYSPIDKVQVKIGSLEYNQKTAAWRGCKYMMKYDVCVIGTGTARKRDRR